MYGLWRVRDPSPDDAAISAGASILRRGGVVAFPTETVYGLGASALDPLGLLRIFHAKGRPLSDPLIVHVPERRAAWQLAAEVPPLAAQLAAAFWPGPLTLVLPRGPQLPSELSAGLPTIAVRVPSHPVARALLRAAALPIAAPSANRFSRPSPTTAAHVRADLEDEIDAILDGGPTQVGIESTIVAVHGDEAVILRPGGTTREALARVAQRVSWAEGLKVDAGSAAPAPGMLLKHYAPHASMRVVDGAREAGLTWLGAELQRLEAAGVRVGLLLWEEDLRALGRPDLPSASLGALRDPAEAAAALYDGLRRLDGEGVAVILGRMPDPAGLGLGLRDRLFRAACGQIVQVNAAG